MRPYRSIRWMLSMWNMALLAIVLIVLLSGHYHLQRKTLINEVDNQLQSVLMKILPMIAMPDGPPRDDFFGPPAGRPPHLRNPMPDDESPDYLQTLEEENLYCGGWSADGRPAHSSGNAPDLRRNDYPRGTDGNFYLTLNGNRELAAIHPSGSLIVMGHPMADIEQQLKHLRGYLTLIGCSIFLLGFSGGRYMISRALKPIREISKTAEEISGGEHSQRIELASAPEELESLAGTLNTSFNHLDDAIENQKRFSADASHELRTPIAIVLAQTQVGLKRERTTAEYQSILAACNRAGNRMKSMADSLLDLTRIHGNETALNKKAQSVNEVIAQTVSDASNLSDLHPVDFQGLETTLTAEIDESRIHQVLMNLMRNAIQHNPEGCPIHVSLKQVDDTAQIRVADEGSGIPEESLPHVFERFYRADKSRSREHGGTGLGLSIVQSLVEAHDGTIDVHNAGGAVFVIYLPLSSPV